MWGQPPRLSAERSSAVLVWSGHSCPLAVTSRQSTFETRVMRRGRPARELCAMLLFCVPCPAAPNQLRIAIDTGGTFTDCVWVERGQLRMLKVFSTPADPSQAIVEALAKSRPTGDCPSARHHRRHQHSAPAQRRARGARHHRRFRRRHRDRPPGPSQTLRFLL